MKGIKICLKKRKNEEEYGPEQYKNLSEYEKQRLVEYRKKIIKYEKIKQLHKYRVTNIKCNKKCGQSFNFYTQISKLQIPFGTFLFLFKLRYKHTNTQSHTHTHTNTHIYLFGCSLIDFTYYPFII